MLIENATITAVGQDLPVPDDAEVLDCAGRTITAGARHPHPAALRRHRGAPLAVRRPTMIIWAGHLLG